MIRKILSMPFAAIVWSLPMSIKSIELPENHAAGEGIPVMRFAAQIASL